MPDWLCHQKDKIWAFYFQPLHQQYSQNEYQFCIAIWEIWRNCHTYFSMSYLERVIIGQFHQHVCFLKKKSWIGKVCQMRRYKYFFFTYVHTILFWYSWSHHVFFIDWFNFINIKWRNSLIKCPINLIQDFENLGMKSCVFVNFFYKNYNW